MRFARNDSSGGCHCEERSDEAIPSMPAWRLLRFARNDSNGCHCEEHSDEAIPSMADGGP